MTQPVLVLHSDDDPIVPAYLGQRLVERTKEAGDYDGDGKGEGHGEGGNLFAHNLIMIFNGLPNKSCKDC